MSSPKGLALSPDERFLLVVDSEGKFIHVVDVVDEYHCVRHLQGPAGTLIQPTGIAIVPSSLRVLVSDSQRNVVVVFRSYQIDNVDVLFELGTGVRGNQPNQFDTCLGLSVFEPTDVRERVTS